MESGRRRGARADRHARRTKASTRGSARWTLSPSCRSGARTMDDCVGLARSVRRARRRALRSPVYLYARAAPRGRERGSCADIRRPQFEGLRDLIAHAGVRARLRPGPTCIRLRGAIVVGARPFLIAYNINLESPDLALAKESPSASASATAACRGSRRWASSWMISTARRCP